MGWVINPYSIVLLLSLVVAGGTTLSAWRTRPAAGSVSLTALMATVAVWLGAHILEIESATMAWKLRWADVQWLCAALIPTLFLVFALEYTGKDRWLTRRRLGLLAVEPFVMVGLLAINGWTYVLWGPPYEKPISLGSWWTSSATVATSEPRLGLFVHLGYATLCLAVTSVLVLTLVVRNERLYRWQGVAVLVAIAVPWGTAVISTSSLEIIGTTPIGFTVTGLAITFGLYRYRLLELTPIARSEVVANLEDGVLVIDADRRVVDSNPVAQEIFGRPRDALVGNPIAAVVPNVNVDAVLGDPLEPATDRTAVRTDEADGATAGDTDDDSDGRVSQFSLENGTDRRHYELSTSPIDDGRGQPIGWTVVVHDVTDRVRRERELERKNRKLDQFAGVVSHDLRNPLSVSKGYLELLEEEYDPDYVRTVAESHERMEQLIDDVLALTRQGQAALDPGPVSIADVATEAWSTVETDGSTLSIASDGILSADRTQLRQLLENLFRNSVEHGRAEPHPGRHGGGHDDEADLVVTIETVDDGFAVTDSGTGFEDEPAQLFESGYTTSDRGTGLGLSIVADICEVHGWSVTATADADGGARFEITGVDFHESPSEAATGPATRSERPVPPAGESE
ncbi:histidine kinase N-terminal 7TM domain-containing protein [Natrinema sp. 1APR25-10V2]|uniref:histidine kinase N-terminal 7TM domain-containing protein n=1 Tax=Natrinema sp. 1APR25-10V2 TaxID=2951081 RepID=UPI0028754A72|nr:histidine kinase N-terminal 7TM domain-containing protein [Natrinema sp. 1APR25-10V2]MDS0477778.1 PAS domain-containing protein [Natrinema sp. 1APR25-10V2]